MNKQLLYPIQIPVSPVHEDGYFRMLLGGLEA